MSNKQTTQSPVSVIEPANQPLVKPSEAEIGHAPTVAEKALSQLAISEGLTATLHKQAEEAKNRMVHRAAIASAVAEYFHVVEETTEFVEAGADASDKLDNATAMVAKALADAVLAGTMDRTEARSLMGESFGFTMSEKTGKATSRPAEPGNTISKRVSSVTIAAEYALTGILPNKGGDSLPSVGQDVVADLLEDFFSGDITVRAASERIEKAIREARVTVPLEMDPDKLLSFVGKVQTASEAIAKSEALKEIYAALLHVVASIPFAD